MDIDLQGARFLVTGACGFIGANLVRRLLELNASHVMLLDNLFTGDLRFVPDDPRASFTKGSVTDEALLRELLADRDYVINLAAVNIIAAQTQPELDLEVNALGALRVLEAADRYPQIKKILYASSASVYGNPDYLPIVENVRTKPMSNYAVSKLAGENYTMVRYLVADQPTCVVRYSNVYGPFQSPANPYCGVVGKFFRSVLNQGEVTIHGSGRQTRDFTFVADAVDATILATVMPKAEGCIFNVATSYEVSILELAQEIFEVTGREPRINFIEKRDIDNISRRCLNIEHARTRLKWEPRVSLNEGVRRTLEWYRISPFLVE